MEKKIKVEELYELIALLGGFKNESVQAIGFVNEKGISEGTRRIATKTLKKLQENWPKDQLASISAYTEEGKEEVELASIKQAKIKELMDSDVTLVFEELPDFKLMDQRLEERKESLTFNYTYLFDKLFLNY